MLIGRGKGRKMLVTFFGTTKVFWGLPKWKFLPGKRAFHAGKKKKKKKTGKVTFCPPPPKKIPLSPLHSGLE